MSTTTSGLGLFSMLPYELREMIWTEFIPWNFDTKSERSQKADLSILRASRWLHEEIAAVLYHNLRLEFDMTPTYDPEEWCTAYLYHGGPGNRGDRFYTASWSLKSAADAIARGFACIPYHKVKIVVTLVAPFLDVPFIVLWYKVRELLQVFKRARTIRTLTIILSEEDGFDWTLNFLYGTRYAYDMVVVPFCGLANLEHMQVELEDEKSRADIDWTVIEWATNLVNDRTRDRRETVTLKRGRQLTVDAIDRRLAGDYFYVQHLLFFRDSIHGNKEDRKAANMIRLHWLRNWFPPGSELEFDDESESESDRLIRLAVQTCPEVVECADPGLYDLELLYRTALPAIANYVQSRLPSDVESDRLLWDPEAWILVFRGGIPYLGEKGEMSLIFDALLRMHGSTRWVHKDGRFKAGIHSIAIGRAEYESDTSEDSDDSDDSDGDSLYHC